RVREVAWDRHGPAPGFADPPRRFLGVVVLAEIRDGDVGALAGEGNGDRAADAAVAAGNERPATLEQSGTAIAVLAVVGAWHQLRFLPGPGLLLRRLRRRFPFWLAESHAIGVLVWTAGSGSPPYGAVAVLLDLPQPAHATSMP